tara:strand:+ start:4434 stop:5213 length:780 start_codon:yes stop_codon:yes gene_type:complete
MTKRAIMALSGGMDSTSLLLRLLREGYSVTCVSYLYGQKHSIEIEKAMENIERLQSKGLKVDHKIIDLSSAMGSFHSALTDENLDVPEGHYEEAQMKQTVVPNRNAIFSSILYGKGLTISQIEDCDIIVALGVHNGDHAIYPDCRPEFYKALSTAFTIGNWGSERISFELPYINGNKTTILKDALYSCDILNLNFNEIMASTITSYNPDKLGRSSGKSGSDVERILAFHEIGHVDPIEYSSSWDSVLENALKLKHKVGE